MPVSSSLLAQRLQIEDWYRRHPEIDDEPIDAPLIGLGLPRTGSTALSFLLAEDPAARSLRCGSRRRRARRRRPSTAPDPRIATAELRWRSRGVAAQRGARAVDATGPMECQELMALDFKSQNFLAFAYIPSYSDWLLRRRPHLDVRVRAARPPAAAVGRADAAVAAEVPDTPALPRRARPVVPRRAVRDDPSRPGRRHRLGRRRLPRDRRACSARRSTFITWVRSTSSSGRSGMERALAFRDARQRRPVLRHRLPRHAGATRSARSPSCTSGSASRSRDEFEPGWRRGGTENAEHREPNVHPDPATFGLDLDDVRPRFAEYTRRSAQWTAH